MLDQLGDVLLALAPRRDVERRDRYPVEAAVTGAASSLQWFNQSLWIASVALTRRKELDHADPVAAIREETPARQGLWARRHVQRPGQATAHNGVDGRRWRRSSLQHLGGTTEVAESAARSRHHRLRAGSQPSAGLRRVPR